MLACVGIALEDVSGTYRLGLELRCSLVARAGECALVLRALSPASMARLPVVSRDV